MDKNLLKTSIELIKSIRLELHGKVENSVIGQFDDVIFQLEKLHTKSALRFSKSEMLLIFSKVIAQLPTIAKVLDDLLNGK